MTTQEAADILNVSLEYLLTLLADGKLEQDLKEEDVLAYKVKRDRDRDEALEELTRLTEELGGYDDPPGRT